MENIKLAIAEQELVQEKFDEKQILYYLSNITKGDRSDISYAQGLVDTFINSVYVYEDKVVICYNFTGDGSKITIEDIEKAMLEAEERENRQITQKAPRIGGHQYDTEVQPPVKVDKAQKRRRLASFLFGAPSGTRTRGPLIKSQLLYQLS